MDIENLTKEELQAELKHRGIKFHHKNNIAKLQELLRNGTQESVQEEAKPEPVVKSNPAPKKPMTKAQAKLARMSEKEKKALALVRIIVSPNDPNMASYPGLIFTVGSSSVNRGKMIKKYVPFNNEEGWHVPHIIYEQIKYAEMQKFKAIKRPDGSKDVTPYITRKFNVEVLPPLTQKELADLAAAQKSRGDT